MHKMIKEYSNFFLLRSEILRGLLKIFLIYLTRQYEKSNQSESQSKSFELVKNFFALIEKQYITRRMVTDYAEELVITPNYLNEVVKKLTGFHNWTNKTRQRGPRGYYQNSFIRIGVAIVWFARKRNNQLIPQFYFSTLSPQYLLPGA